MVDGMEAFRYYTYIATQHQHTMSIHTHYRHYLAHTARAKAQGFTALSMGQFIHCAQALLKT